MNDKAVFLALHGFVLARVAGRAALRDDIWYRIKRQQRDSEWQLSLTYDAKWEVNRSAVAYLYNPMDWDALPKSLWQSLPWTRIHELVEKDHA